MNVTIAKALGVVAVESEAVWPWMSEILFI